MRHRLRMAALLVLGLAGCTRLHVEGPTDLDKNGFESYFGQNAWAGQGYDVRIDPYYHGDEAGMSYFSAHDLWRDREHGIRFGPFDAIFIGTKHEYERRYRVPTADNGLVVSMPFHGWEELDRLYYPHVLVISRFNQALPGLRTGAPPTVIEGEYRNYPYVPVQVIGRKVWAFVGGTGGGIQGFLYDPDFDPDFSAARPFIYPGTIPGCERIEVQPNVVAYTGARAKDVLGGWYYFIGQVVRPPTTGSAP